MIESVTQQPDRLKNKDQYAVAPNDWAINRMRLEALRFNRISERALEKGKVSRLDYFLPYVTWGLKAALLYNRGEQNARDIVIREHELFFENLPAAFDGYRILHISDLHIDSLPGVENDICDRLETLSFDTAVFTGDYRWHAYGEYSEKILAPLRQIFQNAQAPDGVYATLGNHDTRHIAEHLEEMQVRVLNNESIRIQRGEQQLTFTGTDDPHSYFTLDAVRSLEHSGEGFKVALVHSPELYQEAAQANYDLYLCGHTHAGQVCLPGGVPILRNLSKGHHLVEGLWQHDDMVGYTSAGCGVSGIPVRFFSRGEITRFTLRKK